MKKHLKLKQETDQLTTKSLDSFAKNTMVFPGKNMDPCTKTVPIS